MTTPTVDPEKAASYASSTGYIPFEQEPREQTVPGGESAGLARSAAHAEDAFPKTFYEDEQCTIFLGDFRALAPFLAVYQSGDPVYDAVVTDPPYQETSLTWDDWPNRWPEMLLPLTRCLWCFGSMRMFLEKRDEFIKWKFAQEIVWEKHNGSGFAADRFKRVHELAAQFYLGPWESLYKKPVIVEGEPKLYKRRRQPPHAGEIGGHQAEIRTDRMMRSVAYVKSCHGYALHPTQKPEGIVRPLLEYSVPPGGRVLDPFMGSGTTLVVAKEMGLHAVGFDTNPDYCEIAARRLSQESLRL